MINEQPIMSFKAFLLTEGKQDVIQLGYPPIIASTLYKLFGQNAYLLSKWWKDYKANGKDEKDWWRLSHWSSLSRKSGLYELAKMYEATQDSDSYKKALEFFGLEDDEEFYDEATLEEKREYLKAVIEDDIANDTFFNYYNLVEKIIKGDIKDLAPYKNLSFWDAQKKFDKKNVFQDTSPLKTYPNGYKWINVGKRCHLVGHLMKNCGSAGVMSMDNDRTMIVLFDKNNTPHVITTYSPNEGRLSGDQGRASSEVKSIYHDYVLDLADTLNARFDADGSKSAFLKVKYLLKNVAVDIQRVGTKSTFDEYFVFTTRDGKQYYTNGSTILSAEDMQKLKSFPFKNKTGSIVSNAFNYLNTQQVANTTDVAYIPMTQFVR